MIRGQLGIGTSTIYPRWRLYHSVRRHKPSSTRPPTLHRRSPPQAGRFHRIPRCWTSGIAWFDYISPFPAPSSTPGAHRHRRRVVASARTAYPGSVPEECCRPAGAFRVARRPVAAAAPRLPAARCPATRPYKIPASTHTERARWKIRGRDRHAVACRVVGPRTHDTTTAPRSPRVGCAWLISHDALLDAGTGDEQPARPWRSRYGRGVLSDFLYFPRRVDGVGSNRWPCFPWHCRLCRVLVSCPPVTLLN